MIVVFEALKVGERELIGIAACVAGEHALISARAGGPLDTLGKGTVGGDGGIAHEAIIGNASASRQSGRRCITTWSL